MMGCNPHCPECVSCTQTKELSGQVLVTKLNSIITLSYDRLDSSMRGKEKAGAPPIRSLLQTTSPAHSEINSPYSTPLQVLIQSYRAY